MAQMMKHQTRKGDRKEPSLGSWKLLFIKRQASKACDPGKEAFYYPASRQRDKAPLCIRQFVDLHLDTRRRHCFGWHAADVDKNDEGDLNCLAGGLLLGPDQLTNTLSILLIGQRLHRHHAECCVETGSYQAGTDRKPLPPLFRI